MDGLRTRWVLGVTMAAAAAALAVALIVGAATSAGEDPAGHTVQAGPAAPAAGDVEVPALRTARSRTYRRPDGSYRAMVSVAPINVRSASGAWTPIDTALQPGDDPSDGSIGCGTSSTSGTAPARGRRASRSHRRASAPRSARRSRSRGGPAARHGRSGR